MLGWLGVKYEADPVHVNETPGNGESPLEYVQRMSSTKAKAVSREDDVTLGADTIVVYQNEIMGKPVNAQDARKMLGRLRGNTHKVHTALCLYQKKNNINIRELCSSDVKMRDYSTDELKDYVTSGDPMDKAGAYAIQNRSFHPVEDFHGCMANVMGLPLCHLQRGLRKLGVGVDLNISAICKDKLNYDCVLSQRILDGENLG